MKVKYHILFWILVGVLLVLFFGNSLNGYVTAFYFTTLLLPVAMATTYIFNFKLIPDYLMKRRTAKFILYGVYTFIFSVYLEMVVITVSFIILANYQYKNLSPIFYNVVFLAIIIYLIVFIFGFILLWRDVRGKQVQIQQIQNEKQKFERGFINIRADRSNIKVFFDQMVYVESFGDYLKIHVSGEKPIVTKEKISSIEQRLPDLFLRIHRSFLVNRDQVKSFNKEEVMLGDVTLPISRTYKKAALSRLEKETD